MEDHHISLAEFAKRTKRHKSAITILCKMREEEGGIIPYRHLGRKYIDINKYPVEKFKLESK